MRFFPYLLSAFLGTLCLVAAGEDAPAADAPAKATVVEDFRLPDQSGRSHQLYRLKDAKAVVLFYGGIGCPIVRQSIPELARLREAYGPKGVEFLMINANPQDDRAAIIEEAQEFGIGLPILRDEVQAVTRMLGAERTAEAFVVDPQGWRLVYRGAIDDRFNYGTAKAQAEHRWLQEALDAVIAGRGPATAQTDVKGCRINLEPVPEGVSYAQHVAPVMQAKCVRCHSEGNVAPFAFEDYRDASSWAPMIREVLLTQRMPPWHARPDSAEMENDRSLSPEETRAMLAWIDAGAPRGAGDDVLAAASGPAHREWPLGEPDKVVALETPTELTADGVFDYMYFRVPSGLTEDAWVRAVDVQPGNRKVLHHALIFVLYPPELRHLQEDFQGGLEGFFAGYVPGQDPQPFPEGTGKFVPKGSSFVFQMHYTATGKPETDQTRLGLYFSKEKPAHVLETRSAFNTELRIPAGDGNVVTTASHRVSEEVMLWALSPHMHFRGSWFEYELQYPDGKKELLLSVPNYDFNWQTMYRLKEPKRLPAGTVVNCRGGFDNSPRNPANPDPKKEVRFGEQTWDEMFIGYMEYSPVATTDAATVASGGGEK